MKIAVIGGAGVRTVIFINGLLARYKALHIDEVALYDINQEKQQIITKLCRHVVNRNHKDLIVTESADVRKVLQDADYVVTTLRVGGDHSRHAGANDPQRRESRAGRIRHPAQRDDSSLGQHSENRRMRAGDHVDDRHADPYGSVRRVHRHAGRYDDRRPGRSGRRHHGRARPAAVDARLR